MPEHLFHALHCHGASIHYHQYKHRLHIENSTVGPNDPASLCIQHRVWLSVEVGVKSYNRTITDRVFHRNSLGRARVGVLAIKRSVAVPERICDVPRFRDERAVPISNIAYLVNPTYTHPRGTQCWRQGRNRCRRFLWCRYHRWRSRLCLPASTKTAKINATPRPP
jgi:hypothetical protein